MKNIAKYEDLLKKLDEVSDLDFIRYTRNLLDCMESENVSAFRSLAKGKNHSELNAFRRLEEKLSWHEKNRYWLSYTNEKEEIKKGFFEDLRLLVRYLAFFKSKRSSTLSPKISVKGLFDLSLNPPAVFYKGKNKDARDWKKTKGRTQSFAMLRYFGIKISEKGRRSGLEESFLRLPFRAIEEFIGNKEYCDRPPSWDQNPLPKRRAATLVKNTKRAFGFLDEELFIEDSDKGIFIVLKAIG